jgi:hypothetical protein
MITNATRLADARSDASRTRVAAYAAARHRPGRIASSLARLEEVERHLAALRAQAGEDGRSRSASARVA